MMTNLGQINLEAQESFVATESNVNPFLISMRLLWSDTPERGSDVLTW